MYKINPITNNKICVVVPNYNRDSLLLRCLKALDSQVYDNFYVIIVDSSDKESVNDVLSLYYTSNKYHIIHTGKRGLSIQRNIGITKSFNIDKFDYITFVDSDDVILPTYLLDANKLLEEKPDILATKLFVSSDLVSFYNKAYNSEKRVYDGLNALIELLNGRISASACGKFYKTELLKNVLFDENISFNEDYEFNYRVFLNSNNVLYSAYSGYCYYQSGESMTRKKCLDNKQLLDLVKANRLMLINETNFINGNELLLLNCMNLFSDNYLSVYPRLCFSKLSKHDKGFIKAIKKNPLTKKAISAYKPYNRESKIKKQLYLFCPPLYRLLFRLFLLFSAKERYGVASQ